MRQSDPRSSSTLAELLGCGIKKMAGNKFINRDGINTSAQRNCEGDHFHVQRDAAADLMKENEAQEKRIDDGLPLEEAQFCEGSGASKLNKVINEECKQRGLFSDPKSAPHKWKFAARSRTQSVDLAS